MRLFTALCLLLAAAGCQFVEEKSKSLSPDTEIRLAISSESEPATLDPRFAANLADINLAHMLFEGLTQVDSSGALILGVAKNIQVSPDLMTYTFQLRECNWSNGEPVTAYDFEYSLKSQFDPEMKAPNRHMLDLIKGAKAFAEKKDIGIGAPDAKTLVIVLERPTPYFLQIVATPTFFPVSKTKGIGNGPFCVEKYTPHTRLDLKKNDHYWDSRSTVREKVHIFFDNDQEGFSQFQQGKLDWIGAPLSKLSRDEVKALKKNGLLTSLAAPGTHFLQVNVDKSPCSSINMRRALCSAIDSQKIIDKVMGGNQQVATGFVPEVLGLGSNDNFVPYNVTGATEHFNDALSDLGLTRQLLPAISLLYVNEGQSKQIAEMIRDDIKAVCDIEIDLQGVKRADFQKKISESDYTLALDSFFATYYDPMSFLSLCSLQDGGFASTHWVCDKYTELLEASCLAMNEQERFKLLQSAQDVLMEGMPVIPLFYSEFDFGKSENILGITLSPMGVLDVRMAYAKSEKQLFLF